MGDTYRNPESINRDKTQKVLTGAAPVGTLWEAFVWSDTLEGHTFWEDIACERKPLGWRARSGIKRMLREVQ